MKKQIESNDISESYLTYENVRYGMLVEVYFKEGGYHAGCKVHFYNKKGVLVGNYYEFLPYERLRIRTPLYRQYPRYFMDAKFEKIKYFLFKAVMLKAVDNLIRFTQKYMD